MKNKIFKYALLVVGLLSSIILLANISVTISTKDKVYDAVEDIPVNRVGMVLGTAKMLRNGQRNLYFQYRIDATVQLYQKGKIEFVLVSGDNSRSTYDEPTDFKNELILRGIPSKKIYLDYAGFRTLDSVVRAKEIFGLQQLTIISQQFHNERAIFIAEQKGMQAIGFNAQDISGRYGIRVQIREYLARVKLMLDIVMGVEPKFLGEPVVIK